MLGQKQAKIAKKLKQFCCRKSVECASDGRDSTRVKVARQKP